MYDIRFLLPLIVLLFSALAVSWQCQDEVTGKRLVAGCLREYFNHTGQHIPPTMMMMFSELNVTNASKTKRSVTDVIIIPVIHSATHDDVISLHHRLHRSANHDVTDPAVRAKFHSDWCRPFGDYYTCLLESVKRCYTATSLACRTLNIFVLYYGNRFCDPRVWEKRERQETKDGVNVSTISAKSMCNELQSVQSVSVSHVITSPEVVLRTCSLFTVIVWFRFKFDRHITRD